MKTKQFGFILLLGLLIVCVFPAAVKAEANSGTCGDNVTWVLDNKGTLTISGKGEMTDYTAVGESSPWEDSAAIHSVVIEDGVTNVGDWAFIGCTNLASVTIPKNVTRIGEYSFDRCTSLEGLDIPGGVTSIGKYAFNGSGLKNVTIPNGVTQINEGTFKNCKDLVSVTIPGTVTYINNYFVFKGCSSLKQVNFEGTQQQWSNVINANLFSDDVVINCLYHTVTVEGGTAGVTTAKAGDTVTITADEPEEGMSWVQWSLQDGIDFAQTDGFTTTFTMPARDVTVHAVFKEITPKELDDQVYTGEAFTPTFGLFGLTLNGVDAVFPNYYDLSYEANVNAGEAKVTVTMKAPYKGTKTVTFQILPADLSKAAVSEIPDQEYTGKEIKPEPTVTWNGQTLVKDKDYTLSYKDNVHAGDASVIVTGKGNFDSKTAATDTFSIVQAPLTVTALPQTYNYNGKTQGEGDTVYEDPAELAEKVSVEGLQGDDILTGIVLDGQGKETGRYLLEASNASIGDNTKDYDILYVPGTLTIEPAEATITVDSSSKLRGGDDPAFTGTVKGLVKKGDLGKVTFVRKGDDEAVGSYKGVLTAKFTDNKNYSVTVKNGDFTIMESFMVRWLNGDGSVLQEKTYAEGEAVPKYSGEKPEKKADKQYTYQFTGWDNGTGEGAVTTYKPLFKETLKPTPTPVPVRTKKTILTAKASASGKKVTLSWNRVRDADRYVVYFSRCNGGGRKYKTQQIKAVKANKLKYTVKGLVRGRCYKFWIAAQKKTDGRYKTVVKSTLNHFIAGNESRKLTVPRTLKLNRNTVRLKVKESFRLKGTVMLYNSKKELMPHAPKLRFCSSDTSVATVSTRGKIKAKGKGTCTIYVQTVNGISKKCRVTVK